MDKVIEYAALCWLNHKGLPPSPKGELSEGYNLFKCFYKKSNKYRVH